MGEVVEPVKAKVHAYRLTKYSLFWLLVIPTAVGYEFWALFTNKDGGALSHVMWWAYGAPHSTRWWFVMPPSTAFLLWCAWHFAYRFPSQYHLIGMVAASLVVGAVGYLITR